MRKDKTKNSLIRVLKISRPYQGFLVGGVFCTLLLCGLRLIVVSLLGRVVNSGISEGVEATLNTFLVLSVAIIGLALITGIKKYLLGVYTQKSMYTLRSHVLEKISQVSISELEFKNTGAVVGRINISLNCIENLFKNILPDTLYKVLVGVLAIVLGIWMNVKLTLALVLCSVICALIDSQLTKSVTGKESNLQKVQEELAGVTEEVLEGHAEIKLFDLHKRFMRVYEGVLEKALKKQFDVAVLCSWHEILIDSIGMLMQIGVILYGITFVSKQEMNYGDLVIFQQIADLIQSFIHINYMAIWKSVAGSRLLFEVWDVADDNQKEEDKAQGKITQGDFSQPIISFQHVSFAYESKEEGKIQHTVALQDVSFDIYEGETVALVGASGSGKSTILKMICGFIKPTQGTILYRGYDYESWDIHALCKEIAYLEQNTYLFPVSLYENIACGLGQSDEIEEDEQRTLVEHAINEVQLNEFVQGQKDGYHVMIEEMGANLSGGQKQRVGIARAFLKQAPLLLLDEPTNALDNETEKSILKAVHTFMKGRTIVSATHKLEHLKEADRILVFVQGRMVESGTHETLRMNKGVYDSYYCLQVEGDKEGEQDV